jgi:hypothetical protein
MLGGAAARTARTLYAAQYVIGGGYASILDLINREAAPSTITLEWFGDDGKQIGATGTLTLPAQGATRISDPSIFGITSVSTLTQGYVRMRSSQGSFDGWVRFSDPAERQFGSAMQFVEANLLEGHFTHIAQNEQYFTGLAIINPNSTQVFVQVSAYDVTGARVAISTPLIPAGGRFSMLLSQLMPGLPPMTRGYFRIISWSPVTGFALFGTTDVSVLAAIPVIKIY